MQHCTRCGSLAWDGQDTCPACGAPRLEDLAASDVDLRGAVLLVSSERPELLSDWPTMRVALSDVAPALMREGAIVAALDTGAPYASEGEGMVRMALSQGRYPFPEDLVEEVVDALGAAHLLTSDAPGFAANPPARRTPSDAPAPVATSKESPAHGADSAQPGRTMPSSAKTPTPVVPASDAHQPTTQASSAPAGTSSGSAPAGASSGSASGSTPPSAGTASTSSGTGATWSSTQVYGGTHGSASGKSQKPLIDRFMGSGFAADFEKASYPAKVLRASVFVVKAVVFSFWAYLAVRGLFVQLTAGSLGSGAYLFSLGAYVVKTAISFLENVLVFFWLQNTFESGDKEPASAILYTACLYAVVVWLLSRVLG